MLHFSKYPGKMLLQTSHSVLLGAFGVFQHWKNQRKEMYTNIVSIMI